MILLLQGFWQHKIKTKPTLFDIPSKSGALIIEDSKKVTKSLERFRAILGATKGTVTVKFVAGKQRLELSYISTDYVRDEVTEERIEIVEFSLLEWLTVTTEGVINDFECVANIGYLMEGIKNLESKFSLYFCKVKNTPMLCFEDTESKFIVSLVARR